MAAGKYIDRLMVKISADSSLAKDLEKAAAQMQGFEASMARAGAKAASFGSAMTKAVTIPIVGVGIASVAAYMKVDESMDKMIIKAGATGQSALALQESYKKVAVQVPTDLETIGSSLGLLSTRTGLTGADLENMGVRILDATRMMGEDATQYVDQFANALAGWGVPANEAAGTLDFLFATAQKSGMGLGTLTDGMSTYGASFRELGLSFVESASLMGQLNMTGAETDKIMASLSIAVRNLAKAGEDPKTAFIRLTEEMKNAGTEQEALKIGTELFGRSAVNVVEAIRSGKVNFADLAGYLTDTSNAVNNAKSATEGFDEKLGRLKNKLAIAGSGMAEAFMPVLESIVQKVGKVVTAIGKWISELPGWAKEALAWAAAAAAMIGPLSWIIGKGSQLVSTVKSISKAISGIGSLFNAAGFAVSKLGGALGGVMSSLGGVGGSLGAIGPAGWLAAGGVAAAGLAVYGIVDALGSGKRALEDARKKIQATKDAWDDMSRSTREATLAQMGNAQAMMENIKGFAGSEDIARELGNAMSELGMQMDISRESFLAHVETFKKFGESEEALAKLTATQFDQALNTIRDVGAKMVADGGKIPGWLLEEWHKEDGKMKEMLGSELQGAVDEMMNVWEGEGIPNTDQAMAMILDVMNRPGEFAAAGGGDARGYLENWVATLGLAPERSKEIVDLMMSIMGQSIQSGNVSQVQPAVGSIIATLQGIPPEVITYIGANDQASGVIVDLIQTISRLINMNVMVHIGATTEHLGGLLHSGGIIRHLGGIIPKAHSGLAIDERLIIAQTGEFMMQRKAVSNYGLGFMKAVNEGRLRRGGDGGFSITLNGGISIYSPNPINPDTAGLTAKLITDKLRGVAEDAMLEKAVHG